MYCGCVVYQVSQVYLKISTQYISKMIKPHYVAKQVTWTTLANLCSLVLFANKCEANSDQIIEVIFPRPALHYASFKSPRAHTKRLYEVQKESDTICWLFGNSLLIYFTIRSVGVLIQKLICSWYIMHWVTFLVPVHYSSCKRDLLANDKDECLAHSSSTPGSSSNTPHVLTWITWEVEEYNMIHTRKVDSSWCPVRFFVIINFDIRTIRLIVREQILIKPFVSVNTVLLPIGADQKLCYFLWTRTSELLHVCKPWFLSQSRMKWQNLNTSSTSVEAW